MTFTFTAPAGALAAAVKYAARWITTKPTIPAHGGLLFELPAFGDRLSIFGFNENATGRATLDIDSNDAGSFVVSGRLLDQLVATFPDKPVTFELDDSHVSVIAGRWRGTLPTMSVKDYPALPGLAPLAGTIDGSVLADAVERVGAAASRDLTKQVELCGVHITFGDDDSLTLMATDTYRGARVVAGWKPGDDRCVYGEQALVLAPTLVDAVEAFDGDLEVTIGWDAGAFSLSTPDRSLTVRTLNPKNFPVGGLGPIFEQGRPAAFVVKVKDLALPLKRADLLRGKDADQVLLRLSENLLTIQSSSETAGGGDEEIDVEYAGPDTEILVRSATLQGALHTTPGDVACIAFAPGVPKPMLVTSPADPAWRHILVPLKDLR